MYELVSPWRSWYVAWIFSIDGPWLIVCPLVVRTKAVKPRYFALDYGFQKTWRVRWTR